MRDVVAQTERVRARKKDYWDSTREIDHKGFEVNDLVLLWDAIRDLDMSRSRKLDDRWLGPYRIAEANVEKGYYRLEDLDGSRFKNTTPQRNLKKFN